MFAPATKWSALVATPSAVPEMVRKAFKLAQAERPGAVYLAVPEDVEEAAAPPESSPFPSTCPGPTIPPPHSSSVLPRFCAGRAIPSCWPVTGGPQRRG